MKIVLTCLVFFILYGCNTWKSEPENKTDAVIVENTGIHRAMNRFGFDLYAGYAKNTGDNIFFSPYSISAAMAIACEGARGKTAEEIRKVFYFPSEVDVMRKGFLATYGNVNKQGAKYILNTANALWAQKDFEFKDDYLAVVEKYYGGKAENLDFINGAAAALKRINKWVEEHTGGKIKNLVPQGYLDRFTRLVITNAVYFKGEWIKQFNAKDTVEEIFKVSEDERVTVSMMRRTDQKAMFNYAEDRSVQILEMPYSGDEISMLILLPKNGDMESLERILSVAKLNEWKAAMQNQRVDVFMPKFRLENKYFMTKDLSEMGMPTAFTELADFSGISVKDKLLISDIIHQAFIEVDEEGTEAAAATSVIIGVTSVMPEKKVPVFRADRPFIFIIQQTGSGNILFIGRMSNPARRGK